MNTFSEYIASYIFSIGASPAHFHLLFKQVDSACLDRITKSKALDVHQICAKFTLNHLHGFNVIYYIICVREFVGYCSVVSFELCSDCVRLFYKMRWLWWTMLMITNSHDEIAVNYCVAYVEPIFGTISQFNKTSGVRPLFGRPSIVNADAFVSVHNFQVVELYYVNCSASIWNTCIDSRNACFNNTKLDHLLVDVK